MPRKTTRGGRPLRLAGALVLVAGVVAVYLLFPTREPASWQAVHGFELDSAECERLRREREVAQLAVPASLAEPLTVAEAARWFHLELAAVCRANDLPPSCGEGRLSPGVDVLRLPLARDRPPAGAGPAAKRGESR